MAQARANSFHEHRTALDITTTAVKFFNSKKMCDSEFGTYLNTLRLAVRFFEDDNNTLAAYCIELAQLLCKNAKKSNELRQWWWRAIDHQERTGDTRATIQGPSGGSLAAAFHYERARFKLKSPPDGVGTDKVRDRFAALKKKIVSANKLDLQGMREFSVLTEIPADAWDKQVAHVLTAPTAVERLMRLVHTLCLPDVEALRAEESMRKPSFGETICPEVLISEDGHPMDSENRADKRVYNVILEMSRLYANDFMRPIIRRLRDESLLTTDDVLRAFYDRGLVDQRRINQFGIGVDYWLTENSIASIHILIPEIEAMARRISESRGADVLSEKPGTSNVLHFASLNNTLAEARKTFLPENIYALFRVVFTEHGLNLRNKVCHGFARDRSLTIVEADLIGMCFLHLLRWEIRPSGETLSQTSTTL